MAKINSTRKRMAEINVVPYIDVMLVLLVIFMVTAPLMTQGVHVDLPQASANPIESKTDLPLIASVNSLGEYYLKKGADKEELVRQDEIREHVAAYLQLHKDINVVVRADKKVRYEEVIRLMVLLQEAGVPSVGLMTDGTETDS